MILRGRIKVVKRHWTLSPLTKCKSFSIPYGATWGMLFICLASRKNNTYALFLTSVSCMQKTLCGYAMDYKCLRQWFLTSRCVCDCLVLTLPDVNCVTPHPWSQWPVRCRFHSCCRSSVNSDGIMLYVPCRAVNICGGGVSYLQVFVDLLQNSLVPGNGFKIMSSTKTFICKMSKH